MERPHICGERGIMGGWEILAWVAVALVTVLRVVLVVGIVAIVVAIVRGVRAYEPASGTPSA